MASAYTSQRVNSRFMPLSTAISGTVSSEKRLLLILQQQPFSLTDISVQVPNGYNTSAV